jgi:hypothetical protein
VKLLQGAVLTLPIGAALFSKRAPILGPPIGRLTLLVVPFAVVLVGIGTVLPWLLINLSATKRLVGFSVVTCVLSLAAYSSFVQFFVAPVGISSQGRTAYVTVGYRLAEQYRILYRNQSSSEVLKDQGYEEDDIERVWTQGSLFATRLMGLMTYLLVLGSINVCIGALARTRDLIEQD